MLSSAHAECAREIAPPGFGVQLCLLFGISDPLHHARIAFLSAQVRKACCQKSALVEASGYQPCRMQRYGYERDVGTVDEQVAAAPPEVRERARQICPSSVLQQFDGITERWFERAHGHDWEAAGTRLRVMSAASQAQALIAVSAKCLVDAQDSAAGTRSGSQSIQRAADQTLQRIHARVSATAEPGLLANTEELVHR